MRLLLPCLLVLASSPLAAADSGPDALLENCARWHDLDHAHRRGLSQFDAHCPGLQAAIGELGLSVQLDPGWRARIDPDALRELLALRQRYALAPPAAGPDVQAVPALARSLQASAAPPQSVWQRFKAWLRAWLESGNPSRTPSRWTWLDQWLAHVHPTLWAVKIIAYSTLAIVIALAAWIIGRELRAAGILSRRPTQPTPDGGPHAWQSPRTQRTLRIDELESMPVPERPAALLQLLVQALRRAGRLGVERALTHRELVDRARLEGSEQRARFERVAQLAERQIYGVPAAAAGTADADVGVALAEGVGLHRELSAMAGRAP